MYIFDNKSEGLFFTKNQMLKKFFTNKNQTLIFIIPEKETSNKLASDLSKYYPNFLKQCIS